MSEPRLVVCTRTPVIKKRYNKVFTLYKNTQRIRILYEDDIFGMYYKIYYYLMKKMPNTNNMFVYITTFDEHNNIIEETVSSDINQIFLNITPNIHRYRFTLTNGFFGEKSDTEFNFITYKIKSDCNGQFYKKESSLYSSLK